LYLKQAWIQTVFRCIQKAQSSGLCASASCVTHPAIPEATAARGGADELSEYEKQREANKQRNEVA